MLVRHKELIKIINNSDTKFIIFGFSDTTKQLLEKYPKIIKKIDCILDNNKMLSVENFKDIPVKHFDTNEKYHYIFLLWGNHVNSIKTQLNQFPYKYYIDYDCSKQNILPKNFKFIIETPGLSTGKTESNHIFSKKFISYTQNYIRKIDIRPIEFTSEYHSKERFAEDNTIYFSYHSHGLYKKNLYRWKEGYLKGYITFDSMGYSGWSSSIDIDILKNKKLNKVQQKFFNKLSNYITNNNISKYPQPKYTNFNFPDKFVFFPLQTINDSVMEHSYFDPIELIINVAEILFSNNVPLLIKRHPRCNSFKLEKVLKKLKKQNKVILYSGSIHNAIQKCDCVYVINSGVGFESLLYLKPVVTFGKSDYMSVTNNIKDLKQLKLKPIFKLTDTDKENIIKFVIYHIKEKSIDVKSNKKIFEFLDNVVFDYIKRVNCEK